jgi:polysaccharide pyruvyl transferase WcaK-like protein
MPRRVVLLNDTSSYNHHGCDIVVDQVRRHCERHDFELWHRVKLGDDWRAARHRKRLAAADLVIVNGEGSFHRDRKLALTLAQSAPFCRERGIPCFLINSVYQDNGAEMAHSVRQFSLIFVRESRSQKELREVGVESEVVPDMTLSHPDLSQRPRHRFLVTDSSSDTSAEQLHAFYARAEGAELASLFKPVSIVRALRHGVTTLLGKRAPKLWRFESARSVKSRHALFAEIPPEQIEALLERISSAKLIVTGRFHMVCLAMLARTPFVALEGNTHKIEGLLADSGLSSRHHHRLPDPRELLAWSTWRKEEVLRMEAYLETARARIAEMFVKIRQSAVRS